jgi:hypothetical protein
MPLRALCIHGHFYQPPREDPLTGDIPAEPGVAPYPNWNERIHAECYQPNAEWGNFERISFNIGPTLFSWIADQHPATYRSILAQDHANIIRYGVGNAIAQGFNHTILPLAATSDKTIQIAWGIADFEHRFGRKPQGMWLPETAADLETLTILARQGIEFTILAPWQAADEEVDPTEAYRVVLPEGHHITVFFYQRELSSGVSFNPSLTANADHFALYNLPRYYHAEKERRGEAQLLLLASDGELYGHHQPFREQFLAHLLNGAGTQASLIPTFPALWLKTNPPRYTIKIRENTSWSCHHGIARWAGECSCTPGGGKWKASLRSALDRLAAALDGVYFDTVYLSIPKPRSLRERYIHVLLGNLTAEELINSMADHVLTDDQTRRIHLLLRAQYERQRMFTSCGWYHEDFDRIEPKNNLAYAAQAVNLTFLATGDDLSTGALSDLRAVVSSRTGLRGEMVFLSQIERARELGGAEN